VRITVDLDADILAAAKQLAVKRQESIGRVVSDLVRQTLQSQPEMKVRPGSIPVLPRKPDARPVTSQMVTELMDLES
jgi:hypothetical protein